MPFFSRLVTCPLLWLPVLLAGAHDSARFRMHHPALVRGCSKRSRTSVVLTRSDQRGAVRCCRSGYCFSICHPPLRKGEVSRYPKTCIRPLASTAREAEAECAAHGARLCAASEYARLCCGSGCLMDNLGVWVNNATDRVQRQQPTRSETLRQPPCPLQCMPKRQPVRAEETSFRQFKPIAACVVGQVRGFSLLPVYQSSHRTLIAPLRDQTDVFFALSAQSAGNWGVGDYDEYPNRTGSLPSQLLKLFDPVAIEWARADRKCCKVSCEGGRVCTAAVQHTVPDPRCAQQSTQVLAFGQQFNLWRAWHLVVSHETSARGGRLYTWVLRFRPDNLFDKPLPPYSTWPSSHTPILYSDGGEALALSSQGCCGNECIGGADQLMLATREAARVYMAVVYERYFTWPQCRETQQLNGTGGCDARGPAGALPSRFAREQILGAHGVGVCKSGLNRMMIRESSPKALAQSKAWLRSPIHHQRHLPLRPLVRNASRDAKDNARCLTAREVCSYK